MRTRLLLPGFLALAIGAGASAALLRKPPESQPDQMVELAPGVYFRHGDLQGHGHCNHGVVVFEDFVLVIDGNFPSGADACLKDIRKLTDKPVRLVFDTHHHGDHAYGNPVWMANGVLPMAHEKVVSEMRRFEPRRWREAAAGREDVRSLGRDGPLPPVITFPDRMVLEDASRRVELLHFGTAHTRGDGFAYLPWEKILFTGDAVVNGPHNYMGDGNSESWLRVLDALAELDIEIVAPGHGPCGDKSLIADQRLYFQSLREAVAEGIAAGRSLAELQESIKVPERVARYAGGMFRDQVAKVHAEMTGLELPLELEELGFQEDPSSARPSGAPPPKKILITAVQDQLPAFQRVAPGIEIVFARSREEMLREVEDADALIGRIDRDLVRRGKRLRWVHSISAGVENYVGIGSGETPGIAELVESPIILTNGRRCYGVNIADQVFAFLLNFTRQVKASIEGKAASGGEGSRWSRTDPEPRQEVELRGRTMLIVGAGGIGVEVARRAEAFGMRVLAVDPTVEAPPPGVAVLRRPPELKSLLPQADVLVLACPLTQKTRGLIGKEELGLLPPGAYLINVARGRVVDHEALAEALKSGRLAGAGLDVTEPEPLPDSSPLWQMENVIITPHNAGQSDGSRRRIFLLVRENIRRFVKGEPLLNVVDKARGY
jgi:cyclase